MRTVFIINARVNNNISTLNSSALVRLNYACQSVVKIYRVVEPIPPPSKQIQHQSISIQTNRWFWNTSSSSKAQSRFRNQIKSGIGIPNNLNFSKVKNPGPGMNMNHFSKPYIIKQLFWVQEENCTSS